MTRFLLYLVWSILSIMVVIVLGVFVALTVFDEQIEDRLVAKIELNTGRDVSIQGGFGFYFNPAPTFYAKDIKMANAQWGSQPWMLEIDSIEAVFSLKNLLQGEAILTNAKIVRPRMLVEQDAAKQLINWGFNSKREPKAFKRAAKHLRIESASIYDAQVRLNVGPVHHVIEIKSINGQTDPKSKDIQAVVTARIHDQNVSLKAGFNNLRHILLRESTTLQFSGTYGQTKFTGKGQVADIMRWQGHEIAVKLQTPSLDLLQGWVTTPLIQTPPLTAHADFVQPNKWRTARLDNVRIINQSLGGEANITGYVGQLQNLSKVNLNGTVNYSLAKIMQWKNLESSTDAQINATFSLYGDKETQLSLAIDAATLKGKGVLATAKGIIPHILQDDTQGIPITFEANSLSTLGRINDKPWHKTNKIKGQFSLRKKAGKLSINEVEVFSFDERFKITGILNDIVKTQKGQFELSAKLNALDVSTFNTLNNTQFPTFELSDIKGGIQSLRGQFSAQNIRVSLFSKGVDIQLNGEISDFSRLRLKHGNLILKAQTVRQLNKVFGSALPELGKVNATGILNGDLDNLYDINNIKATVNNKHQLANITGSINNLGEHLTAKLKLGVNILGHENLPQLLDSKGNVPGILTGYGEAKLIATGINDWSANQIQIKLEGETQGQINGEIRHFPVSTDIALAFNLSKVSLKNIPKHKVLDALKLNSVDFSGELIKPANKTNYSIHHMKARLQLNESKNHIQVNGSIDNVATFDGMNLDLTIQADDLSKFPYLEEMPFKKGMPGNGSFTVTGGSNSAQITINQLKVLDSDMKGGLSLILEKTAKPKIKARLTTNYLDILSLFVEEKRTRLFSTDPLALAWMQDFDLDLQLDAKHLNGLISQFRQAKISLTIQNGILQMPNANGFVGEGNMAIWLTIFPLKQGFNIITSIKGEHIKPRHFNLFGDSGLLRNGLIEINIGLAGKGSSLAEFMGNASGKILLELKDVALKNKNIELFGADLISGVLNIVNPFKKKADYLNIDCGVIHFPVLNGIAQASQGIAIKTSKVTVLGGGNMNLGSEQMNILIKPKARRGLGLSAGTLANVAKISGSFSKPKISVDAASLAQSALSIGAAVASSGLTLLAQALFDRNKANSDVCQQTRITPNDIKISLFQTK